MYTLTNEQRSEIIQSHLAKKKYPYYIASSLKEYLQLDTRNDCILVEDNLKPQQIIQMCLDRNIKHIIQNSKIPLIDKINSIDEIITNPLKFMTFNQKFYSDNESQMCFGFNSKDNRTELVNRVLNFFEIDPKNHNTEHILKSVEELIMNAQVHAPKIGDFKSPHSMSFLAEKKGPNIALSVFDDYGSMNINKFLNKILNTYTIGTADSINYGAGGAGLGSSIIFQSAEALYIAVLPKRITRVTIITPIKVRAKDREIEQKTIHIINTL
jgi:hypothetical protein